MKNLCALVGFVFILADSFAQAPVVSSFSPVAGPIGSSITITGSGFNPTAAQNVVFFGAIQAAVTAASAGSIAVTVPLGATYDYMCVTNLANNLTGYSDRPFNVTLAGQIFFGDSVNFTTGTTPQGLAVADIDGDLKSDLIVTNSAGSSISVLLNTSIMGTASFAPHVDFTTGATPRAVTTGDIDGDGKPDVIVANNGANTVSVFRNTSSIGSISFAPRIDFTTQSLPCYVSVGDFNLDGKPDMAVANYGSNTVSVFRDTSTIGVIAFATRQDFATPASPNAVSIGDIDGDTMPELVTANYGGNSMSVFRDTSHVGAIGFAARVDFTTAAGPFANAIADIDGNGKMDVIVASRTANQLSVFRSTSVIGTISFAPRVDFATATAPQSVSVTDIDGDGKPDISVAENTGNFVSTFKNTSPVGNITMGTRRDFVSGSQPYNVRTGDMDGDGKPDLIFTNAAGNNVSVILQAEAISITSFTPVSGLLNTNVTITGTGFNSNPALDVVCFGPTRATVVNASTTTLNVTVPVGTAYEYLTVTNTADNLTASSAAPFTVTTPGGFAFAPRQDFYSGWPYAVCIGDIDGDGKPDMVVANFGSNQISVFRNTSVPGVVSFAPRVNFITHQGPNDICIADLDGDGKKEIITSNSNSYDVSVFRNTSTPGTISLATRVDLQVTISSDAPQSICVGDLDADGRPEIIITCGYTYMSYLKNNSSPGTISFASYAPYAVPGDSRGVCMGDLDGDGRADIATANTTSTGGSVSVFRNTSSYTRISFAARQDIATATRPNSICSGDIDGDGKPDLAMCNEYTNNISVLRNTSTPGIITFAPAVDTGCGTDPYSIDIGDIDGDGRPDLVTADYSSWQISVIRNTSVPGMVSFAAAFFLATSSDARDIVISDVDGDGRSDIEVANDGGTNASVFRQMAPAPTLTSFSPASGCAGTTIVTITGNNFSGATSVLFGGTNALSYTVNSSTQITAVVGNGTTGQITVVAPGGTVLSSGTFTVNPVPTIGAGAVPQTICAGSTSMLTGTGGNTYSWNPGNISGSPVSVTPTSATTYTVTGVDVNGCSDTATISISVLPQPSVTATVIPSTGEVCAGDSVILSGSGAQSYAWSGGVSDSVAFAPASGGTYTVTGTGANGCTATAMMSVTVNPLPMVTFSFSPQLICVNSNAVALNASPVNGVFSGPGVNGNMFDPSSSGTGTFVLTYSYTDANGCTGTDTALVNVDLCLGISSTVSDEQLHVLPDPSGFGFVIYAPAGSRYQVCNSTGQLVTIGTTESATTELDLRSEATGIYFINITTPQGKTAGLKIVNE